MTTLATMRSRIIDETMRPDLETAIGREIIAAINFYRSRRFWFTEKDTVVLFNTVVGQSDYAAAAQANIPNLISIDSISIFHDGETTALRMIDQLKMEAWLNDTGALRGDPSFYSYYGQRLRLYAIPDAVSPVRIAGVIRVAAPASDTEPDNPWMTDAEELIRMRASGKIYANLMRDPQQAQVARAQEEEALGALMAETSSRMQVNSLIPDCL